MTHSLDQIDFLDAEALIDEQIELSSAQMEQAAQLSQSVDDASRQWQIYLHALALFGFKQWLEEWTAELEIDDSRCSIAQPDRFIAVHHLFVSKFNLCLIATPVLLNSSVCLPTAVVDLRQFAPHLYVLIEVQEEQMQIKVLGYLRRDHLFQRQRSQPLKSVPGEMYAVPLDWFNLDPTALLLELRCLKPFSLNFLPEHQSREINVRHWLSDCLDDLAWELGWKLMPSLASASALRSAQEEVSTLGMQIPLEARGVYKDLLWGAGRRNSGITASLGGESQGAQSQAPFEAVNLRLQAVSWVLSAAIESFEWILLIIVSGDRLPIGTRLEIRDDSQLLFEQMVESAEATALFAQVGGDLTDRFWVTIDRPDGSPIALPPFCFDPDFAV